jgi:hypothetical protein
VRVGPSLVGIVGGPAVGWDAPLLSNAVLAFLPEKICIGAAGLVQGDLKPRQAARIALKATRFLTEQTSE